jgi:ATP-binding cassette subfamily G (WHITE) protein 2 (SNQ2)
MIDYFERSGAAKCGKNDNPAEYILDVIGAGATAKADRDWHEIWKASPEASETVREIKRLQQEYAGRNNDQDPLAKAAANSTFAVSWLEQFKTVQYRMFQLYWRTPTYIMGKLILNVFAGLFLGFTFYKENSTAQGLQNKIFAIFMSAVLAAPLMNQLQPQFIELSKLYAVREKPSKMYHWTTFVLANIFVEIPYNIVTGTLFFLPWYYAVGFWQNFSGAEAANRGGYMYYVFVLFQVYFTTFGQAVAAMSPNQQTAAALTSLLFSFVILFNGVLQPLPVLVKFWHWMYHLSPFTYLISGYASNVLHDVPVRCATKELSIFSPPSGSTCQEYAGSYVTAAFGYLNNPNATENCEYCRFKVGDEFLLGVNMKWSERWRNSGLLWVYILFNIVLVFLFFYLTRVASFNMADLKAKMSSKKEPVTTPSDNQTKGESYEMDNSPVSHERQEEEIAVGANFGNGFTQEGGQGVGTGETIVTGNRQGA